MEGKNEKSSPEQKTSSMKAVHSYKRKLSPEKSEGGEKNLNQDCNNNNENENGFKSERNATDIMHYYAINNVNDKDCRKFVDQVKTEISVYLAHKLNVSVIIDNYGIMSSQKEIPKEHRCIQIGSTIYLLETAEELQNQYNALDVSISSGSSGSASTSSGSMSQSVSENTSSERSFDLLLPSTPAQNGEEYENCWTPESVGNHSLNLSPIPIMESPSDSYESTSKSSWNASSSSSDLSDSLEALRIRIEMSPNGDERPSSSNSQNESFEDLAIRDAEEREEIVDPIEKEEDDQQGELAPKDQMQEIKEILERHAQETQTLSKRHAQEIQSTLEKYAIVGRLENNQILGNVDPREVGQAHGSSGTLAQLKARIQLLEANNEKLRKYESLDCLMAKIRSLVPDKEQAKKPEEIFELCKSEWKECFQNESFRKFSDWLYNFSGINCERHQFYFNAPQ